MRKTLIAKEGFIYTNGESFARVVDLAKGDEGAKWYEITRKEYEQILKEQREAV